MTPTLTKNAFVAGGTAATASAKTVQPPAKVDPIYAIQTLDELEPHVKVYNWGMSGSGKTFLLAKLVEAGYKIAVVNSDVGGNGLNTIVSYLKQVGKPHLRKNILIIPIPTYQASESFLENPAVYVKKCGGPDLWQWDPTIFAWEGYGNWQQVHAWDHVVSMTGGKKQKDSDLDGLALATMDYGLLMKATHFAIDSFCRIQNPYTGATPHKIYQAHVDDRPVDMEGKKVPQEKQQGVQLQSGQKPWIMGQGAKLVTGACDFGFRSFSQEVRSPGKPTQIVYGWDFTPGERNGGKTRSSFTLGPVICPVDPLTVWNAMLDAVDAPRLPAPAGGSE